MDESESEDKNGNSFLGVSSVDNLNGNQPLLHIFVSIALTLIKTRIGYPLSFILVTE